MRFVFFLSLLILSGSDSPSSTPPKAPQIGNSQVVIKGGPILSRLIILVDCSGSMVTNYEKSPKRLKDILTKFGDDGFVKVYGFRQSIFGYSKEWIPLPNQKEIEKISKWLISLKAEGGTLIGKSVETVLHRNKNEKEHFSLLLITDGQEGTPINDSLGRIRQAQNIRENGPVIIHSFGFKSLSFGINYLERLVHEWHGWLLVEPSSKSSSY